MAVQLAVTAEMPSVCAVRCLNNTLEVSQAAIVVLGYQLGIFI